MMKRIAAMLCLLLAGLGMSWSGGANAQISYGEVPTDYLPTFGGWNPRSTFSSTYWTVRDVTNASLVGAANVIVPNDGSDVADRIMAIAASSPNPMVIYFPAGQYELKKSVTISRSNIVIRGAGKGLTTFVISAPSSANAQFTLLGGGFSTEIGTITNVPMRGDDYMIAADVSGIAVNDILRVYDNSRSNGFSGHNWQQFLRVTAIDPATRRVTFASRLGLNYNGTATVPGQPRFVKVNMIQNVAFENFTITRTRNAAAGTHNLFIRYAWNAHVRGTEVKNLVSGGISLGSVYNALVTDNDVHNSVDPVAGYGDGGKAYGINVGAVSICEVSNNKLWNLRHHIILHIGTNFCVVAYNSAEPGYFGTSGDLDMHGYTAHNNLYEGNQGAVLIFDGRSYTGMLETQGLYNTMYRNQLRRPGINGANGIALQGPASSGNFTHFGITIVGNDQIDTKIDYTSTGSQGPYNGANIVKKVGANRLGETVVTPDVEIDPNGTFPASLYAPGKPAYLGSKPWPLFGPGVADWGRNNTLPAADRPQTP